MLEKNTKEYWEEVARLSDLLRQWNMKRDSDEIARQVMHSMQSLGLIVSVDDE